MKRDDDLIREILLQVEGTPANMDPDVSIPHREENEVLEHLELLIDAGLIEGTPMYSEMGDERISAVNVQRLTWEGHEFVANARNEKAWQRMKQLAKEKGGAMSFEVMKALLVHAAKDVFGLQ